MVFDASLKVLILLDLYQILFSYSIKEMQLSYVSYC